MTAPTNAQLSQLLEELLAEKAVVLLLARYANLVDYGDPKDYASLFTTDGFFELQSGARNRLTPDEPFPYGEEYLLGRGGRRTEKGFRFEGHEGLYRFITGVSQDRLRLHAVLQPVVKLGDREAWVESQMIALGKEHGQDRKLLAFGRYHDHIVRENDGQWRFKSRICEH